MISSVVGHNRPRFVGRLALIGVAPDDDERRLCGHYAFEERGPVFVKGKGEMQAWLLQGRLTDGGQPA